MLTLPVMVSEIKFLGMQLVKKTLSYCDKHFKHLYLSGVGC